MLIVWGTLRSGRIQRCDGTCIVTDFFHVCFVPLFPLRSIVFPDGVGPFDDVCTGDPPVRIGLHPVSVAAGFARVWAPVLAGLALVWLGARLTSDEIVGHAMTLRDGCIPMRASDFPLAPENLLLGAGSLAMALVTALSFRLGRLRPGDRDRLRVYAMSTGLPVDAAAGGPWHEDIASLRATVIDSATSLMTSGGYRTTRQPERQWLAIALDPTVTDCAFLGRALTLARMEWSKATGPDRAALGRDHDALWEKLRALAAAQGWTAPADAAAERSEGTARAAGRRVPHADPDRDARERRGLFWGAFLVLVLLALLIAVRALLR